MIRHCKLIALISQKGGAGKTTVTMQLAAGLAARGHVVGVVDLDPQESALRWAESALPDKPFPATVVPMTGDGDALREALNDFVRKRDFVLFDCPPSIEHPHALAALQLADLAVVPVVPSPPDLWSARAVERLILQQMDRNRALKGILLPNRVQRTALSGTVLEVMRDFTLPVLDTPLYQRNAYAQSAVTGSSVFQLGRAAEAAQQEVDRLAAAVTARLS